jgi:hypothetical protein
MSHRRNLRIYQTLVVLWIVLLVLQYIGHTYFQGNFLVYAVDSLAPIPVIVLVVVFIVGIFMERREQKARKQQLMFLKSCMFRLELRDLYTADFLALKSPSLTFGMIKAATLEQLRYMRREADVVEYRSPEEIETVIAEYVEAEGVWRGFMNMAREEGFDDIFQDMLSVMHFVSDVKTFKRLNPAKLFAREAAKDLASMERVTRILGDGIRKYLDYAIELKEKQPDLFDQVIGDYELLAGSRT